MTAVMTGGELKDHALGLMREGGFARAGEAWGALTIAHPDTAAFWFLAGQCAELAGDYILAAVAFRGAVDAHKRKPQRDRARSHFSLGSNLFRQGKNAEAETEWRIGLKGTCDTPEAKFVRSQVRLAMNSYCYEAWLDYEQRRFLPGWQSGLEARGYRPGLPEWDGHSAGCVAVVGSQGAGDCIQFARYLPLVHLASGSRPVVLAGREVNAVLPYESTGEADYWVPMDSLPFLLRMYSPIAPQLGVTAPPSHDPPLAKGRTRVGVCWKGSAGHTNDLDRSCHDLDFMTELQDERWELVSLQHNYGLIASDYRQTAELMRTLDAVVTVDSSVTHLAGTLGIPTLLVPPASPEWRWSIKDETSKWYPSVTLVRRKNVWAWDEALERCKHLLVRIL